MRHYIGRLAHHIRASKDLIEESSGVSYLLETYAICIVEPSPSVLPPKRDSQTNLRGILNRMTGKDDKKRAALEEGLCRINDRIGIFDDFLSHYEYETMQVHAEVQVLTHFHRQQLSFVDGDRFIACSKPACFCCQLYFKYHPAYVVLPSSHLKIWVKWSPPIVEQFDRKSAESKQQQHILNKMTEELRDQVISQVMRRSQPSRWHPDSRTGITEMKPCHSDHNSLKTTGSAPAADAAAFIGVNQQCDPSVIPAVGIFNNAKLEADLDVFDLEDGGVSI